MRKMTATAMATAAAALVAGIGVGTVLNEPTAAVAQETTTATEPTEPKVVTRLGEVLTGLVADGVITRAQAEAVEQAITDAGLFRFGHFHGRGMHLDLVAQTIGIEVDDLLTYLEDGQTIAEVATANGLEPQAVIEALVGDHETRLDELVADERITEEQAEELRAELAERAEALVNGEIGLSPAPFGRHFGLGPPWLSDGAEGGGESSTAGA